MAILLQLIAVLILVVSTPTPAVSPSQVGFTPVSQNADWTPVERDFDGVTMVLVPAGCFRMGNDPVAYDGFDFGVPDGGEQCFDAPFWLDKLEVSNAQFAAFNGVAGQVSPWSRDEQPRGQISWFEARDFCELRGARLPTEREWEYAARGPDGWLYAWGNEFNPENAVYGENSNRETAAVGSRPDGASWVGALDMTGNVWEWVDSIYAPYPYDADDGREDMDESPEFRIQRGGSWGNLNIDYLHTTFRHSSYPDYYGYSAGFRCARD